MVWSATGDINAGRGSKTTTIFTPPKREYDNYGNIKLSPTVRVTRALVLQHSIRSLMFRPAISI